MNSGDDDVIRGYPLAYKSCTFMRLKGSCRASGWFTRQVADLNFVDSLSQRFSKRPYQIFLC